MTKIVRQKGYGDFHMTGKQWKELYRVSSEELRQVFDYKTLKLARIIAEQFKEHGSDMDDDAVIYLDGVETTVSWDEEQKYRSHPWIVNVEKEFPFEEHEITEIDGDEYIITRDSEIGIETVITPDKLKFIKAFNQ